jgi:arylsulfatase A
LNDGQPHELRSEKVIYPHYRSGVPHSATISGSSKVIHFYHQPDIPMLFDLSGDIGEVKNIAKQQPEKHQKLHSEMMRYLKEVGARCMAAGD